MWKYKCSSETFVYVTFNSYNINSLGPFLIFHISTWDTILYKQMYSIGSAYQKNKIKQNNVCPKSWELCFIWIPYWGL